MTTTLRKTFAGFAAAAAMFSLSACGTSTDDVEDHLKSAYKDAGLNDDTAEKLAECLAPKFKDGLSDDGLDTVMDADGKDIATASGEALSAEDSKVISDAVAKCMEDEDINFGS